ncbi:MAG: DUF2892 domain-containing protein [Gammaproteobacteria bacterium]|nr:DUF2892 domain-containing protein [Gammaproteobacteria bacterium]
MINLFKYENHIRLWLGIGLLTFAVFSHVWWLAFMAVALIYTGAIRFCPVFYFFGINSASAERRYHLSLLPDHHPEPVYLFNKQGELVFRNDAARSILPRLRSLEGFHSIPDRTDLECRTKMTNCFLKRMKKVIWSTCNLYQNLILSQHMDLM